MSDKKEVMLSAKQAGSQRMSAPSNTDVFSRARASVARVEEVKSYMEMDDLPPFLSRQSQIMAIVDENKAIAEEATQKRDAPTGPRNRIGVLVKRHQFLLGKGGKKAKKPPPTTTSFFVPGSAEEKHELAKLIEAELKDQKEEMKELTEAIKPSEKRIKNVTGFRDFLEDRRAAVEKEKKIAEMKRIKEQKEEAAKAYEAKKGEMMAEAQETWNNASLMVKKVMGILETVIYRGPYGDEFDALGRGYLAGVLEQYIEAEEEIVLYMLAFPFKSASTAKTASPYPDLAEVAALQTLGKLLTELNAAYEPGARYVLISDGVTFSDIYGIRDDMMLGYLLSIQEMCYKIHPKLECRSMYDVFPEQVVEGVKDGDKTWYWDEKQIRDEIFDVYQPSQEWVMMQREIDGGFKAKGMDFQKFLYEDADPAAFANNNQRNNHAKRNAMRMLQRDEALRIFTMGALPNGIRVSIRPRSQAGPTYCINMIGQTQREMGKKFAEVVDLTTPWHNVLIRIDENEEDSERTDLLPTDKRFYMRNQFVSCFKGAKPIVEDGRVQAYSIPAASLEGEDPTKDYKTDEEFTIHTLPEIPTEEVARLNRIKAVKNAERFGWDPDITAALKNVGDKILNKEVTREMVNFGAGNDNLLLS